MMRTLVAVLLLVSPCVAEITVTPTEPGLHAVVAHSATPGRWLTVRAAPFGFVPNKVYVVEGGTLCIFEADPGVYGLVLIPTDTTQQMETAEVVIGKVKPDPDPDPEPDPDPTPGKRKVVLVYEAQDAVPMPIPDLQAVQKYCRDQGHVYRLVDDDAVDASGQQPAWLRKYLAKMREAGVGVPALVVTDEDDNVIGVKKLPSTGAATVSLIKEMGG
jgi:hypothetical protein